MKAPLQNRTFTRRDRYPGIYPILREYLRDSSETQLVSFGCSMGEELLSLASHFGEAEIIGLEIDPFCLFQARLATLPFPNVRVIPPGEFSGEVDLILALSVLCRHPSDEPLPFPVFDVTLCEIVDHLKPGGILALLNANYAPAASRAFASLTPLPPEAPWHQSVPLYAPNGMPLERDRRFLYQKHR